MRTLCDILRERGKYGRAEIVALLDEAADALSTVQPVVRRAVERAAATGRKNGHEYVAKRKVHDALALYRQYREWMAR